MRQALQVKKTAPVRLLGARAQRAVPVGRRQWQGEAEGEVQHVAKAAMAVGVPVHCIAIPPAAPLAWDTVRRQFGGSSEGRWFPRSAFAPQHAAAQLKQQGSKGRMLQRPDELAPAALVAPPSSAELPATRQCRRCPRLGRQWTRASLGWRRERP